MWLEEIKPAKFPAICTVCKKMIRPEDQQEHLRTQHLGPHYFSYEGRDYITSEPSISTIELMKLIGDDRFDRELFEYIDDFDRIYYHAGKHIDLTRRPKLWVDIPAHW